VFLDENDVAQFMKLNRGPINYVRGT